MKKAENPIQIIILSLLSIFFFSDKSISESHESSYDLTADLSRSFDLRNVNGKNYVTPIKNQIGGTCWAHGVMAAIESNLLVTGEWKKAEETGQPDLAEYHLDWWNGFNQHNNDDLYPPSGYGLEVHYGGDYRVASAYLTRGEGAVREIDGQSFDFPPKRTDANSHVYYVRDIEWYQINKTPFGEKILKNAITTHGALGTAMSFSEIFIDSAFVHYQPDTNFSEPNHAIAIVGWDDDKKTRSSQPGAWLCKNSWEVTWGINGYFWISYDDKVCGKHPEMGAISFQNVELMQYDRIYFHDYHGWRDTKTDCQEAFNSFTSMENESLKAVSFFTATDDIDYQIKIYNQFNGFELNEEVAEKSGNIDFAGFHTIDLDDPVLLYQGKPFYIYLYLSNGGHPFDRTSEVPVLLGADYFGTLVGSRSEAGQSYYWNGTEWVDLYEEDLSPWPNQSANFCIKGLATIDDLSQHLFPAGNIPENHMLLQNYPNPFNGTTMITYFLSRTSKVVLSIYNLQGQKMITLIDQIQFPGVRSVIWSGKDQNQQNVSSGIYMATIYIDQEIITKKMILMK